MSESKAQKHSKNVCHFDISLENFLINDIDIVYSNDGQIKFCFDSKIQIKLCDYGLAEIFDEEKSEFESTKYCGKRNYKSPEVTDENGRFKRRRSGAIKRI